MMCLTGSFKLCLFIIHTNQVSFVVLLYFKTDRGLNCEKDFLMKLSGPSCSERR